MQRRFGQAWDHCEEVQTGFRHDLSEGLANGITQSSAANYATGTFGTCFHDFPLLALEITIGLTP
jgi:hypothetical protein